MQEGGARVIITPVDPCPELPSLKPARVWFDDICGWCARVGPLQFGFFPSLPGLVAYLQQAGCKAAEAPFDPLCHLDGPAKPGEPGAAARAVERERP
jgi:hypothetical protein